MIIAKIFDADVARELEKKVNEFLIGIESEDIVDISYARQAREFYSVIIVYNVKR